MNDIVRYEKQLPQTAADVRAHVNLVQEVMKAVMIEGTHYGKIPGTPKPSLWKPGAEVLASTFRIAVSYTSEDLSTDDVIRYRVTAVGNHQTTGIVMGAGMGECSSNEEKYKWRKASSSKEFSAAAENRKRIKYGKEYETQQVRTEPADMANTILKMACKRAQVAMTLNVTAASDIFTQDIEDLPEELRHADDGADGSKAPAGNPEYPKEQFVSDQRFDVGAGRFLGLVPLVEQSLLEAVHGRHVARGLLPQQFVAGHVLADTHHGWCVGRAVVLGARGKPFGCALLQFEYLHRVSPVGWLIKLPP